MPLHIQTKIVDKQLTLDRRRLRDAVAHMPSGNYMMILIRNDNDRDKNDWQKFYRYVIKQMSEDTGYDPKEMHEIVKIDVLLHDMDLDSTTKLDTKGWADFFEYLSDWALDKFDFII